MNAMGMGAGMGMDMGMGMEEMEGGFGEMDGIGMGDDGAVTINPQYQAHTRKLIEIVTATVEPDTWEQLGGGGTITDYQGLLIVNHNAHAHRKIEKVLNMLHEAINDRPKTKR